jgi:protein-S-isoprenylcysteine O-methyltransferase Ste14
MDLRLVVLAALFATAGVFLLGVRRVFRRAPERHGYRATLASAVVLVAEATAIALSPVPAARAVAALATLAAAVALFAWAARVNRGRPLGLAFAATAPEHVQTCGPYAIVRHPFYASYLLAFVGGWIAAGTLWIAPAFLLGLATYWRAARGEERGFLASPLAGAYASYAGRVGMFVPLLGRGAAGQGGSPG